MDRRDLKKSGAVVAGGLLADLGIFEQAAGAARRPKGRPNIVFILVDEMRFPRVFPAGVDTPAEFLRRYMPNVFYLWHGGEVRGLLQFRQRPQPGASDDRDRPVPTSAVAARDADHEWAVAAAGASHLREAAATVRLPDPVFRQVAPLQSTGQWQHRRLPGELRLPRDGQTPTLSARTARGPRTTFL